MKLHRGPTDGNVVTGVGPDWLRVGTVVHRQSLLLTPDATQPGWAAAGWDALVESDFTPVLALSPEVVLLGSGALLRFLHPRLFRQLTAANIGVETMDTPAAARTFNILAAEGRRVAAALIVGPPDHPHRRAPEVTGPRYTERTSIDDTP